MDSMTVLSQDMFQRTQSITTVSEAVALLLSYEHFRTLGDVLRSFCPQGDLRKILIEGLLTWFPDSKPEAADRKIRNWLNGKTQSISKADAYVISHILELSLNQTDNFLKYACAEGIHWRNPEDIAWCYTIVHRLNPIQTQELLDRVNAAFDPKVLSKTSVSDSYTEDVHNDLLPVLYQSEEALLSFLKNEQHRLGTFHNTAHLLFTQYMDLLKRGWSEFGTESYFEEMTKEEKKKAQIPVDGDIGPHKSEDITVRDILEVYMHRKIVPVQTRGQVKMTEVFSAIQKSIRQNWPDEASLSKMESRKLDVSRKALVLLFLATDGTDSDYEDFDAPESPDDVFQSVYTRLDAMLEACGFPKLDPRNPFDWVILFCIASGDFWEIDSRLQKVLIEAYPASVQSDNEA